MSFRLSSGVNHDILTQFAKIEEERYNINPLKYESLRDRIVELWEGDYIPMGREGDEGFTNPKKGDREQAIKLTVKIYNELRLFEDFIKNRHKEIDDGIRYCNYADSPYEGQGMEAGLEITNGVRLQENPYDALLDLIRFYHNTAMHLVPTIEGLGDEVQTQPDSLHKEVCLSKTILPGKLDTPEAMILFDGLCENGLAQKVGNAYAWLGTNALFGYFVLRSSDKLNIRYDNGRLPWGIYQQGFSMTTEQISTAKNFVSNFKSRKVNEPQGYDVILQLCK